MQWFLIWSTPAWLFILVYFCWVKWIKEDSSKASSVLAREVAESYEYSANFLINKVKKNYPNVTEPNLNTKPGQMLHEAYQYKLIAQKKYAEAAYFERLEAEQLQRNKQLLKGQVSKTETLFSVPPKVKNPDLTDDIVPMIDRHE